MKKLAAGLLLFATVVTAHGQTSAGSVLLGGSIGYNHTKVEDNSTNAANSYTTNQTQWNFSFAPVAGYFVADNLAVGVSGSYSVGKSKATSLYSFGSIPEEREYRSKGSSVYVGPFARYYKMLGEKAAFFGQLSGSYGTGSSETEDIALSPIARKQNFKGVDIMVTPGFTYFVTNKVGLELTMGNVGYSYTNQVTEATQQLPRQERKYSGYGAYFGLQNLAIGASVYL